MARNNHKYKVLSDEELIELLMQRPLDNNLFRYFLFDKCKSLLCYISSTFYKSSNTKVIFGEFYEFLSENDWKVLRSWKRKNNSTFNNYLTACAVNYFMKEVGKEKKRNLYEFVPNDPEQLFELNQFTAEEEVEQPPVWEAFKKLDERERTILQLLVIEGKSAMTAAPVIWKYINSAKELEQATEKNIQSTISVAKSRALLSLTKELQKIDKGSASIHR